MWVLGTEFRSSTRATVCVLNCHSISWAMTLLPVLHSLALTCSVLVPSKRLAFSIYLKYILLSQFKVYLCCWKLPHSSVTFFSLNLRELVVWTVALIWQWIMYTGIGLVLLHLRWPEQRTQHWSDQTGLTWAGIVPCKGHKIRLRELLLLFKRRLARLISIEAVWITWKFNSE